MKISIFSIVFNIIETLPKDMFKINVLNMYDFVDEIIIIEGATKSTKIFDGDTSHFTNDGKSSDGTIELLKELELLPKIKVIYGNGFWDGKTSMCNAASNLATGDYLWQIDSDEFYKDGDIIKIKRILDEKQPDGINFYANHFFGGWDYCIDERSNSWGNDIPWKRIFKHIPKKSYWLSHEPPIYVCDGKNCDNGSVIDRDEMLKYSIKMYHYSYVQESQIYFKSKFFRNDKYNSYWDEFKTNKNILIFGSKVEKFIGEHPTIIKNNYSV